MAKKRSQKAIFRDPLLPILFSSGRRRIAIPGVPHCHSSAVELHFFHEGRGFYFIKDRRYPIRRNSALIARQNEVHYYIPDTPACFKQDTRLIFLPAILSRKYRFLRDDMAFFEKRSPGDNRQIIFGEKEAAAVRIILAEMGDEMTKREADWRKIALYNFAKLAVFLKRAREKQRGHPAAMLNPEIKSVVQKAIAYLEDHFLERIALAQVASSIALSPYYLSHIFKKYTGTNFKRYLIKLRIIEARRLLETAEFIKISSVASETGFSNFNSFNRNFKLFVGVSPKTYRKFYHQAGKI